MADVNESIETLEDIDNQIDDLNSLMTFEDITPVMPDESEDQLLIGEEPPSFEQARQLIVIDERVDDVEALINDVLSNGQTGIEFDIIRLDSQTNGIEAITAALSAQGNQRYDAVHIVAHGSNAEIQLGGTTLNSDNLQEFQNELSSWTSGLALGSDILLYGCEVAQTEEGQWFVDQIGQWTGADIASSSDLTGHADLGGDWEFEYIVGTVETELAFSLDVQQNWSSTLETVVTVTTLSDVVDANDGVISLREAIIEANASSNEATQQRHASELDNFNARNVGLQTVFDPGFLYEEIESQINIDFDEIKFAVGAITSFGSLGYILWSLRGGALMALALSQLPSWRMIAPLTVLDSYTSGSVASDEDKEFDEFFG